MEESSSSLENLLIPGYKSRTAKKRKYADIQNVIQFGDFPQCVIGNVVSTFSINVSLNQKKLALYGKKKIPCYYEPKTFASTQINIMADGYPRVKMLLFPGPKQVIVGGKSEEHSRMMAWKTVQFINNLLDDPVEMENFLIKNMVANIYMPFGIDIEKIEKKIGGRATFTPGEIHCCRLRSEKNNDMVILFFNTGSILLTGFKDDEQKHALYMEACNVAYRFQISEEERRKIIDNYKKKKESTSADVIKAMNNELKEMHLELLGLKDYSEAINYDGKKAKKIKKPKKVKNLLDDDETEYNRILNVDDIETECVLDFRHFDYSSVVVV